MCGEKRTATMRETVWCAFRKRLKTWRLSNSEEKREIAEREKRLKSQENETIQKKKRGRKEAFGKVDRWKSPQGKGKSDVTAKVNSL